MVKIQKISEIEPCLGFTEFDMLKKYRQSFATSELGRLHSLFPFSELARQMHLKSSALGRKSYFSNSTLSLFSVHCWNAFIASSAKRTSEGIKTRWKGLLPLPAETFWYIL